MSLRRVSYVQRFRDELSFYLFTWLLTGEGSSVVGMVRLGASVCGDLNMLSGSRDCLRGTTHCLGGLTRTGESIRGTGTGRRTLTDVGRTFARLGLRHRKGVSFVPTRSLLGRL